MYSEQIVLFPCHSLEDFPCHLAGADAESLLASWTALWHPALVTAAGKIPSWRRADEPGGASREQLVVVPEAARGRLPDGYLAEAAAAGMAVIDGTGGREAIVKRALEALAAQPIADGELAGDFFALGYCWLVLEVLTRRMGYTSLLDDNRFNETVLGAARAALAENPDGARQRLKECFERLHEARSHFYPVDIFLIDLTLVATTTLGGSLRGELLGRGARNVLISGATLEEMARDEPETLATLRGGIEAGRIGLIGGEFSESELPLLSHESILGEVRTGISAYERLLGCRPVVYGRWRGGLTPVLPQILRECGFAGALHCTFEEGKFPLAEQAKTRWAGMDGTILEALGKAPANAGRAETFISLPEKLGESIDRDFVATLTLAHWAGTGCDGYDDLRRMANYAPVLGKFVTAETYFRETEAAGNYSKFEVDEYRAPYLRQSVERGERDPISRWAKFAQQDAREQAAATLAAMAGLVRGISSSAVDEQSGEQRLEQARSDVAQAAGAGGSERGYLIVNPLSFNRSVVVRARSVGSGSRIVDVPAMGFAWVRRDEETSLERRARSIATENRLENEFCEVTIDRENGGIGWIRDLRTHGNRLSQQIAIRLGNAPDDATYTRMAADSVEIEHSDALGGAIVSRGLLVDSSGRALASFRQRTSLEKSSRIVGLEIELSEVSHEFKADTSSSYCGCRFAWPDSGSAIYRGVHDCRVPTHLKRIETTSCVEVESGQLRTAILTCGLPFHRLSGSRMLDSLLVVRGESARNFRLGIGIDLAHPWRAAQEMLLPVGDCVTESAAPAQAAGWLVHVDVPNVAVTHLSNVIEDGRAAGLRLRLLEVEGRRTRARMRTCRTAATAERKDLSGKKLESLTIDGDHVAIEIGAYEWFGAELRW